MSDKLILYYYHYIPVHPHHPHILFYHEDMIHGIKAQFYLQLAPIITWGIPALSATRSIITGVRVYLAIAGYIVL